MLEYGNINKLTVKSESKIAYALTDGEQDVFLHFNQSLNKLSIGEEVNAFLYFDQKKRLCATLEEPLITTTKYNYVEIVGINQAGCFMNIGIVKDILLSKDYLPDNEKLWPRVGEKLPCIIKVKKNQLIVRPVEFNDLSNNQLEIGNDYDGIVISITKTGIIVATPDINLAYINKNLLRKDYHVGESIHFKVLDLKENIFSATTIENKEKEIVIDSEIILKYLNNFGGMLPLGNKSTSEEIYKVLHMSKSAFKRACGHLYKVQVIDILDNKVLLKNK